MNRLRYILAVALLMVIPALHTAAQSDYFMHTVTQGQGLYSISRMYGVTEDDIIKLNPGSERVIRTGQELRIPNRKQPASGKFHTIQKGETLYRLSVENRISVKELCDAYGIEPDHLIIIHDELDIDPGTVRVKFGGGHAGHNGLRAICDKLGTRDWYRVRCGIGRPPGRMDVADFVLSVPKKEAADDFAYAVARAAQATLCLISEGLEKAQQQFN